jgi:hypothetical protein
MTRVIEMMRAEKGARMDIGPSSFVLRAIGCGCRGRMFMIVMEKEKEK